MDQPTADTGQGELRSDIGQFSIVPRWLMEAGVSSRAVHLYAILGRYAHRDGHGAFPSRATLAKHLGVKSTRTVDAAKEELRKAGALTWETREREDGGQTSNDYVLRHVQEIAHPPGQSAAQGGEQPVAHLNYNQEGTNGSRTDVLLPAEVQIDRTKVTKIGGRNLPFDALVEATGVDVRNRAQVSQLTKALKDIRRYFDEEIGPVDATPQEWERGLATAILARARAYRNHFGHGTECTPTALAKWWHRVVQTTVLERAEAQQSQAAIDFFHRRGQSDD